MLERVARRVVRRRGGFPWHFQNISSKIFMVSKLIAEEYITELGGKVGGK